VRNRAQDCDRYRSITHDNARFRTVTNLTHFESIPKSVGILTPAVAAHRWYAS